MQGQSLPISFHSQENQIHLKTKCATIKWAGLSSRKNITRSTYFYWLLPLAENGGLLTLPNHLGKLLSQIISHPLSWEKLRRKEPSLCFGDEQPRHGGSGGTRARIRLRSVAISKLGKDEFFRNPSGITAEGSEYFAAHIQTQRRTKLQLVEGE